LLISVCFGFQIPPAKVEKKTDKYKRLYKLYSITWTNPPADSIVSSNGFSGGDLQHFLFQEFRILSGFISVHPDGRQKGAGQEGRQGGQDLSHLGRCIP